MKLMCSVVVVCLLAAATAAQPVMRLERDAGTKVRIPAAVEIMADGVVKIAGRTWPTQLTSRDVEALRLLVERTRFFEIDGAALSRELADARIGRATPPYAWDGAVDVITAFDGQRSHTVRLRNAAGIATWFPEVSALQRLARVRARIAHLRNIVIAGGWDAARRGLARANAALLESIPTVDPLGLEDLRLATPHHPRRRELVFHRGGSDAAAPYVMVEVGTGVLKPAVWAEGRDTAAAAHARIVRDAARAAIRSETWARRHPGRTDAGVCGVRRLSHASLDRRFPTRQLWIVETVDRNDRSDQRFVRDHTFALAVLDLSTSTAAYHQRGDFDADAFWRTLARPPRSLAEAVSAEEDLHDLGAIGRGTSLPGRGLRNAISLDGLRHRLGILPPEREQKRGRKEPIEGKKRWHILSWRLHADDWDLPVSIRFSVISFDRTTGALDRWSEESAESWPSDTKALDPRVQKAVEAFRERLRSDG